MEVRLYKSINFSGYENSKYTNKDTENSILDKTSTRDFIPDNVDLADSISLYDYSKRKIKDLYKYYTGANIHYAENYSNKIIKKLYDGNVESSYIEMVLDLVKDKKLSPYVLDDITGQISSNAAKDIDKLFNAYAKNKDVKKEFIPEFKDEIEAERSIEIGDICNIEGDKNISIKTADGIKKLFITPETYLELFPPVERFICTQSGRLGDCYLLSSIDSMNQNPKTRFKLLEMFRENDNGTVDIAIGGFKDKNGQIIQANPDKTILKDISSEIIKIKDDKITSFTTEGIRAIEILYEKMKEAEANVEIKEKYDYYCELKKDIQKGSRIRLDENDCFWFLYSEDEIKAKEKELKETKSIIVPDAFGWKIITEEEIDYFCKFFENGEKMFNTGDKWQRFKLSEDNINKKLDRLQNKDDDISKYETLILKRMQKGPKDKSNNTLLNQEIFPASVILNLFNDITKFDLLYSTSGFEKDALQNLGLIDTFKEPSNSDFVKEKLFAPDVSKYAFTCASRQDDIDAKIPLYNQHAYSLNPVDTIEGRKFAVRDPHNSLNEVLLTYEELCRYFTYIDGGRLA